MTVLVEHIHAFDFVPPFFVTGNGTLPLGLRAALRLVIIRVTACVHKLLDQLVKGKLLAPFPGCCCSIEDRLVSVIRFQRRGHG